MSVSQGLDRHTGQRLDGWPHVVQSLGVIFSTRFGERVQREWVGSMVPPMLGRNMVPSTVLRTMTAIYAAIEAFEPRYKITQIRPISVTRLGALGLVIEGQYRPRAHLGDFTAEGPRRVTIGRGGSDDVRM